MARHRPRGRVRAVPARRHPRGWKIGIADPEGTLALLRKAQRDGHGHTKVFSIQRSYAEGRAADAAWSPGSAGTPGK
jgi:hypothetical protein